jgi:hypothetical protein
MRIVQSQAKHDPRDNIRQAESSQHNRSGEVMDRDSTGKTDNDNTKSNSSCGSDDDRESSASDKTIVYNEEEQEGATTVNFMVDACRIFPWTDDQRILAREDWNSMVMPHSDDSMRTDTWPHHDPVQPHDRISDEEKDRSV